MIESAPGNRTNVILGGGRPAFQGISDPSGLDQWTCSRQDGRDLIDQWKKGKADSGLGHRYVDNKNDLKAAVAEGVDNILGIFAESHLDYEHERRPDQPGLEDLTEAALDILMVADDEKNDEGSVCNLILKIRAFRTSESADFSEVQVRKFRTLKTHRTRTGCVCLFRIYTLKKSTFHKKIPNFEFFLSKNPIIPTCAHRYLL
jgi:hypothetical protein